MLASTYNPQTWAAVESSKVKPNVIGIAFTAQGNNQTTTVDTKINDDNLIRGIQVVAKIPSFGDKITIKVVDVEGIYTPAGTVLSTPVTDYQLASDVEKQCEYESVAPMKMLGGLYVRVIYVSTGGLLTPDIKVGINLIFNKLLI